MCTAIETSSSSRSNSRRCGTAVITTEASSVGSGVEARDQVMRLHAARPGMTIRFIIPEDRRRLSPKIASALICSFCNVTTRPCVPAQDSAMLMFVVVRAASRMLRNLHWSDMQYRSSSTYI